MMLKKIGMLLFCFVNLVQVEAMEKDKNDQECPNGFRVVANQDEQYFKKTQNSDNPSSKLENLLAKDLKRRENKSPFLTFISSDNKTIVSTGSIATKETDYNHFPKIQELWKGVLGEDRQNKGFANFVIFTTEEDSKKIQSVINTFWDWLVKLHEEKIKLPNGDDIGGLLIFTVPESSLDTTLTELASEGWIAYGNYKEFYNVDRNTYIRLISSNT
jgi:hypothetical protein